MLFHCPKCDAYLLASGSSAQEPKDTLVRLALQHVNLTESLEQIEFRMSQAKKSLRLKEQGKSY